MTDRAALGHGRASLVARASSACSCWARGADHHHGDDVGALDAPTPSAPARA